jgi:hypothetical protein
MTWERYQEAFKTKTSTFREFEERLGESYYTGTILAAKPDPLGRHPLLDIRVMDRSYGSGRKARLVLALAGSPDPSVFSAIYCYPHEKDPIDGDYIRQHGGPGARVQRTGLGAAAYTSSALASSIWHGAIGVYSPAAGPDKDRTGSADDMWQSLVDSGLARRESTGGGTETGTDTQYCVNVQGNDITGYNNDGDEVSATITTDEICGEVEYEYETEGEYDYIEEDAIFTKTNLFVMAPTGDNGSRPALMDSKWDGSLLTGIRNDSDDMNFGVLNRRRDELYEDDDDAKPKVSKDGAEILALAYHGGSFKLMLTVANILRRSVGEDAMLGYLRRLDIANAFGKQPGYLELLGQRRLPGLEGVSLAGFNEIRSVHRAVAMGQLKADPNSENPLHLPAMSARVARKIAKLPND